MRSLHTHIHSFILALQIISPAFMAPHQHKLAPSLSSHSSSTLVSPVQSPRPAREPATQRPAVCIRTHLRACITHTTQGYINASATPRYGPLLYMHHGSTDRGSSIYPRVSAVSPYVHAPV